jgi:hypothetical protein
MGFFHGEDAKRFWAPWDRVVEVAGDLMVPLGMHLERWRVAEFPTPEPLKEMGAEAIG